jgi:translation initiation factor IF-2
LVYGGVCHPLSVHSDSLWRSVAAQQQRGQRPLRPGPGPDPLPPGRVLPRGHPAAWLLEVRRVPVPRRAGGAAVLRRAHGPPAARPAAAAVRVLLPESGRLERAQRQDQERLRAGPDHDDPERAARGAQERPQLHDPHLARRAPGGAGRRHALDARAARPRPAHPRPQPDLRLAVVPLAQRRRHRPRAAAQVRRPVRAAAGDRAPHRAAPRRGHDPHRRGDGRAGAPPGAPATGLLRRPADGQEAGQGVGRPAQAPVRAGRDRALRDHDQQHGLAGLRPAQGPPRRGGVRAAVAAGGVPAPDAPGRLLPLPLHERGRRPGLLRDAGLRPGRHLPEGPVDEGPRPGGLPVPGPRRRRGGPDEPLGGPQPGGGPAQGGGRPAHDAGVVLGRPGGPRVLRPRRAAGAPAPGAQQALRRPQPADAGDAAERPGQPGRPGAGHDGRAGRRRAGHVADQVGPAQDALPGRQGRRAGRPAGGGLGGRLPVFVKAEPAR